MPRDFYSFNFFFSQTCLFRIPSNPLLELTIGSPDDNSHTLRITDGIAKAKSRRGKWGRPSIIEASKDPKIGFKAPEMRSQGISWSEITSNLKIGKTTARRLVSLYQKEEDNPIRIVTERVEPDRKVTCTFGENEDEQEVEINTSMDQPQDEQFPLNDDNHRGFEDLWHAFSPQSSFLGSYSCTVTV